MRKFDSETLYIGPDKKPTWYYTINLPLKEEKTMTRKEFDLFAVDFVNEQNMLMKTKGKDYAGDEDVLTNFKRIASNIGLTPLEAWYVYSSKHWDAITSFVKNGKVESESIRGRFIDMSNYLLLGMAIIQSSEGYIADFEAMGNDVFDEGKTI